jgi:hypothetical protein
MPASLKTALLAIALTLTTQAFAQAVSDDILLPFTDEMALEAGMTPLEEYLGSKKNVTRPPTPEALSRFQRDNRLVIIVDKSEKGTRPSSQTLVAYEHGIEVLRTKISTGLETLSPVTPSGRRYVRTTPTGHFRPQRIYTKYLSSTWNAEMDNAVFLVGGIAIHATPAGEAYEGRLGQRASGGCVRMKTSESLIVRELVMNSGRGATNFSVSPDKDEKDRVVRGRLQITNNRIPVAPIVRANGNLGTGQISSWDTLILVHD